MKRIEMIYIISNFLLENAPETYDEQSSYGRNIDAAALLDLIEENGMTPPFVERIYTAFAQTSNPKSGQEWEKE